MTALRHAYNLRSIIVAIYGGKSAGLACAATLASGLWVGVTIPNLAFVPGLGGGGNERIAISLQSALLGIDDGLALTRDANAKDAWAFGTSSGYVTTRSRAAHGASRPLVVSLVARLAPAKSSPPSDGATAPTVSAPADVTPPQVASPPRAPPPAVEPVATPAPVPTSPSAGATRSSTPDATPPVVDLESDVSAAATGPSGASVTYGPVSATDARDGRVPVLCSPPSGSLFHLGTTRVTCTAKDSAGNVGRSAFSVIVRDRSAPVIDRKPDVRVEATGSAGATVSYDRPLANDAVDGRVPVTCAPASATMFAIGSTRVTCSARDRADNIARSSFAVTVYDTTGLVIAPHPDVVAEATGPAGATLSYEEPTATDFVDGSVPVICSPASGSTFPIGSTTVTCSGADSAHNTATSSFHAIVEDTTGPALQLPAAIDVAAAGPGGAAATFAATATDLVDGTVAVTCSPSSGSTFPLGTTQVSCIARDAAGNSASASFPVEVRDATTPVIAAQPDVTVAATGPGGASVTYITPSATDPDDSGLTVSCAPASGSTFGVGATRVSCRTQDPSGNQARSTFTVTVTDGAAPGIVAHANLTVEATGPGGAAVTYAAPAAADVVDGGVAVACAPASGTTFALGSTTVTCSARDAAGNIGTSVFTVLVRDTSAPVISAHADVTAQATSTSGASAAYSLPTASDLVDGSASISCAPASGSVFPFGSTAVTCSASDAAGNAASSTFDVVVHDSTAPAIAAHGNVIVEASGSVGATVAYTTPTAADLVDGPVSVSCSPTSGNAFGVGSTRVTCSAQDATGNSASSSFTITVRDTTAPIISTPGGITAEATGSSGAVVSFSAAATDIVDGGVSVSCAPASGTTFAVGSTAVTCTALDAAGNSAASSFAVLVRDTIAPTIAAHANLAVEAVSSAGSGVNYSVPVASDAVDGSVAVSCAPASGTTFALGSSTVTCSATDAAGNVGTSSFSVLVRDTTAPAIATHANVVFEAAGSSGSTVTYASPIASDLVDGGVSVACSPTSGGNFALGSTVVTCSARDAIGNTASSSFTVDVRDTVAPALTLPGPLTVEATGPTGAPVFFSASAVDLLDGGVAVSCSPVSGSTLALGTTVVGCSAADAAGNVATGSFSVLVHDVTPPAVADHGTLVAEASGSTGARVVFSLPNATDLVSGGVSVSCAPASGTTFAIGSTLVTCTAVDGAGNPGTSSFTVSVQDTTAPMIAAHANLTVEATGASGATVTYVSPSATDLVDGVVPVICSATFGSTFALGSTVVTCFAPDAAGNVSTSTFTVVVRDSTAPLIAAHTNMAAEATGPSGAIVTYAPPTASDLVDGSIAVSCTPSSPHAFAVGSTLVTCTARDAAGNSATSSFTVTVRDTTPPVIVPHADVTVEATSASGASVGFVSPSANDVVDGGVSVSCAPASGTIFAVGSTLVTCTARDAAGNPASSSFTVVVRDTVAPMIALHAGMTIEATGPGGAVVSYVVPVANDTVDGAVAVSCLPASGGAFALGSTTVTCSARDTAGNATTTSFVVLVRDTTAPVIAGHANIVAEATGPSGVTVTYVSPTASDVVSGPAAVVCAPLSGRPFAIGARLVTCSSQDGAGNGATSSFTVTVRDTTAPTVAIHGDVTVEATGPAGASVTFAAPTASDLVNGSLAVSCAPSSGTTFGLGSTLVTCSATDGAGNTGGSSFTVVVRDTTAPTLAAHGNVVVPATTPSGASVSYTPPTATDAVGSVTLSCAPLPGTLFPIGSTQVTCTARDTAGNLSTSSFMVVVESAGSQLSTLDTSIAAMPLNNGFANALTNLVNAALNYVAQGNPAAASVDLHTLVQDLFTELNKPNPRIAVSEAAQIAASANQISIVIGQLAPGSVVPAGEAATFALFDTIATVGVGNPAQKNLRAFARDVGLALNNGDLAGACASLQALEDTANAKLSQTELTLLLPSVAAARQAIVC